jgi:hypothetical protein
LDIGGEALFDFGFLEFDMLLRDRVVFGLDHFLGHGAAVLLRNIEVAGICRRLQLDLDGGGFGHGSTRPAKREAADSFMLRG